VLYFSAAVAAYPAHHCVGVATSNSVTGPYTAQNLPLVCPDPIGTGAYVNSIIPSTGQQGGAIDPSGFRDKDGTLYVVYKVDGNSIGNGGSCGNSVAPVRSTPIMLVAVEQDGFTPRGSVMQILDRDNNDGPLIEAPSLAITSNGQYALFFSSNCYSTSLYDVTWAAASSITGPYTKHGPMLVTGTNNLYSPGGASLAQDGVHMVFHAGDANTNSRYMYTTTISGGGSSISFT
jgi:beta-xylosidase